MLREAFGFDEVIVGERLQGGYANDLFRVAADGAMFVGDDVDLDACRSFIHAYRAAGGTAPSRDDDLLVPLVRVKRILEVLRAPTDRNPRWDHQRRNLRSLETLASRSICDGARTR